MKQVFDSSRRFFIHDYDGVHYDYLELGDFSGFFADAKVEATRILLPDLPSDLSRALGLESYSKYQDGLEAYAIIARERGMDVAEFYRELHVIYHKFAKKNAIERHAKVFDPCTDTNYAFEVVKGYAQHALLTQSCLDNWAVPLLTRQNRLQYFNPNALMGFAESNSEMKFLSTRPLQMAIERLGAKPEECVFLEDSLGNLKKAKELDPRILTVLISHDRPLQELPDFIDVQMPKPRTALMEAARHYSVKPPSPEIEWSYR